MERYLIAQKRTYLKCYVDYKILAQSTNVKGDTQKPYGCRKSCVRRTNVKKKGDVRALFNQAEKETNVERRSGRKNVSRRHVKRGPEN